MGYCRTIRSARATLFCSVAMSSATGVVLVRPGLFAIDPKVVRVFSGGVVRCVGNGLELHGVQVAHFDGVTGFGEGLDGACGECAVERLGFWVGVDDEDLHGVYAVVGDLRVSRTTPAPCAVSK